MTEAEQMIRRIPTMEVGQMILQTRMTEAEQMIRRIPTMEVGQII